MPADLYLCRQAMRDIRHELPESCVVHTLEEAITIQKRIGFPTIVRPSFTLNGSGGGIAYNREEYARIVEHGLDLSPTNEVLLEETVLSWKQYDVEVVRDLADNCIVVCSIEYIDPLRMHTGCALPVAHAL